MHHHRNHPSCYMIPLFPSLCLLYYLVNLFCTLPQRREIFVSVRWRHPTTRDNISLLKDARWYWDLPAKRQFEVTSLLTRSDLGYQPESKQKHDMNETFVCFQEIAQWVKSACLLYIVVWVRVPSQNRSGSLIAEVNLNILLHEDDEACKWGIQPCFDTSWIISFSGRTGFPPVWGARHWHPFGSSTVSAPTKRTCSTTHVAEFFHLLPFKAELRSLCSCLAYVFE